MYCNACERTVAKAISKIKGVERFTTDMNNHKVLVTGRIDPKKVLKRLKKKTGKRVEIVVNNEKEELPIEDESNAGDFALEMNPEPIVEPPIFGWCSESKVLLMFDDENPNACSIM
ncbi:HMA domain-containing protein [Cephalotus follicularis]|uniref:HMA domain-containing protein n=1 Tax=Cephalotus follicularis TaxID=3775 RepID=A0A1Q3B628_CEPFO|nr:HMA domain-containing protein [Cephalotus follicularis]